MSEMMTELLKGTPVAHKAIEALRNSMRDAYRVSISVECIPVVEALEHHVEDLCLLNKHALMPNPLLVAANLEPAAKLLSDPFVPLDAILVWQHHLDYKTSQLVFKRLVGFLVVHRTRTLGTIGPEYISNWHHLYSYIGHPVIDRNHRDVALRSLFDHLLPPTGTPKQLMMSHIPGSGPLYEAITKVVKSQKLLSREFERHERAALRTDLSGEEYLKTALSSKKRKEFRRLKNRLGDLGEVTFETWQQDDDIAPWIDDFMSLEAAGWKGRRQTAFDSRENWAEFLRTSTLNLATENQAKIWRLSLDGKTIAITIAHHIGAYAWLTKIAYDEAFAKYSPGVLLVLEVTKAAVDDPTLIEFDSCAIPNHPMINRLWREKIAITDILIGDARPAARHRFALTARLITARRKARSMAKTFYHTYLKGAAR